MHILFIDDDPEDIELYKEAIAYLNHSEYLPADNIKLTCDAFTRCDDLIKLLDESRTLPAFIFLDINMPGVSGKECLLMLKQHSKYSDIPVVMLSTSCPTDAVDNYRSIGAFDCIQKPTQFQDLVKIFARFMFNNR